MHDNIGYSTLDGVVDGTFVSQWRECAANIDMDLGVERGQYRDLNNGYVGVGVHEHERDEDAVVPTI